MEPGQIVLAGVTHRFVGGQFRLRDLGRQPVKSFVEAPRRRLTDLVGLATEVQLLCGTHRKACLRMLPPAEATGGLAFGAPEDLPAGVRPVLLPKPPG